MKLLEHTHCSHRGDNIYEFNHVLLFQPKFLILLMVSYFCSPIQRNTMMAYSFLFDLLSLSSGLADNTVPIVRGLSALLRCLCRVAILYKLIIEGIINRIRPSLGRTVIFLGSLLLLGIIDFYFTHIQLSHCCQYIPICI